MSYSSRSNSVILLTLRYLGLRLKTLKKPLIDRGEVDPDQPATADSGGNFGADDIYAAAYDVEGRQLGVLPLNRIGTTIAADFIDAASPGRNFLVSIHQHYLRNAYARAADTLWEFLHNRDLRFPRWYFSSRGVFQVKQTRPWGREVMPELAEVFGKPILITLFRTSVLMPTSI